MSPVSEEERPLVPTTVASRIDDLVREFEVRNSCLNRSPKTISWYSNNWGSHAWEGRSPRLVSRPLVLHPLCRDVQSRVSWDLGQLRMSTTQPHRRSDVGHTRLGD